MALVAGAAAVMVMIALAFALSFSAAVSLRAARNAREAMRLDAVAASALARGMALLRDDGGGGPDTLLEPWAADDIVVSVDGEECRVWIEDEERKLNVNRAARKPQKPEDGPDLGPALERLVVKCGGKETDVDRIREWLWPAGGRDAGAPGGAVVISDLAAAPGLTAELFVEDPAKPALTSLAGTRGDGLNVNTARQETLEALWNDADLASRAVARRRTTPFDSVAAVAAFLRESNAPVEAINLADATRVASEYFTIAARPSSGARVWRALVRRQKSEIRVIHVTRSLEEAAQ